MENASKALIMAGGILIALILISIFLYSYSGIREWKIQEENKKVTKAITEFNAKFEAYNKQIMYGADVISVINMAKQNNEASNHKIAIEVKDGTTDAVINTDDLQEKKGNIFKCTQCIYSESDGKIEKMSFVEK